MLRVEKATREWKERQEGAWEEIADQDVMDLYDMVRSPETDGTFPALADPSQYDMKTFRDQLIKDKYVAPTPEQLKDILAYRRRIRGAVEDVGERGKSSASRSGSRKRSRRSRSRSKTRERSRSHSSRRRRVRRSRSRPRSRRRDRSRSRCDSPPGTARRLAARLGIDKKVCKLALQGHYTPIFDTYPNTGMGESVEMQRDQGRVVIAPRAKRSIPQSYAEWSTAMDVLREIRREGGVGMETDARQYVRYVREYLFKMLTPLGVFQVDAIHRKACARSGAPWWPLTMPVISKTVFVTLVHGKKVIVHCYVCGDTTHPTASCPMKHCVERQRARQLFAATGDGSGLNIMGFGGGRPAQQQGPNDRQEVRPKTCRYFSTVRGCTIPKCRFIHLCVRCKGVDRHQSGCRLGRQ